MEYHNNKTEWIKIKGIQIKKKNNRKQSKTINKAMIKTDAFI